MIADFTTVGMIQDAVLRFEVRCAATCTWWASSLQALSVEMAL
jgi:hypothetical protein